MMNPLPHTSSVVDTKIQNVVLTSSCSPFYTYQSGIDERYFGFAFISLSYFPSPSAFYWVALLALRIAFAETR